MMLKRAGANRAADLKIDAAAKDAARAVRSAGNERATERFLNRYLDYLHETDSARIDDSARRRRRRLESE